MTEQDREAFAVLMFGLGEAYGEPVSDMRIEIYFRALVDLEPADLQRAADVHVRHQKFFPRPAELREAVTGSVEDQAEIAWLAVQRLVRRFGFYNPPTVDDWPDDATRRAAMELYGGWARLCEYLPASGPELLGVAKQFKAAYAAMDRAVTREQLPPSPEDARARLASLGAELTARGLPAPGLRES